MSLPVPEIFKAYDIRGVVETALTPDAVRQIGHSEAKRTGANFGRSPSGAMVV